MTTKKMYHSVGTNKISDLILELLKTTNHHAQVKNKEMQNEKNNPNILVVNDILLLVITI